MDTFLGQARRQRAPVFAVRDLHGVTRRGWLRLSGGLGMAGATAALGLTGCQRPVGLPLTIGMNAWVGYDPLVLAREVGLCDPARLRLVELPTSTETIRQLRNGILDAAALTLDEVLRLTDEGMPLRIVQILSQSAGADVVLADPRITSLRQLRGQVIAVEATTVGVLVMQRMLAVAGLKHEDVQVLNMEASQHLAAMKRGQVTVAVSYEPLAGAIRAAGFRDLFDSRQMPGDIMDVLSVKADVLTERADDVQALLTAWNLGLQRLRQDVTAASELLAPGVGMSAPAYRSTLSGLRFQDAAASLVLLDGVQPQLVRDAQRLDTTLQALGLIRRSPDWEQLIDPAPLARYVRSVAGRGGW